MKFQLALASLFCCGLATAGEINVENNVRLLTLNGEPVSAADQTLSVGNGPQVLGLRYEELFQVSAESHHIVRSTLHYLRFEATMGESYQLSADSVGYDDAKAFANKPTFMLKTDTGDNVNFDVWSREEALNKLLSGQ